MQSELSQIIIPPFLERAVYFFQFRLFISDRLNSLSGMFLGNLNFISKVVFGPGWMFVSNWNQMSSSVTKSIATSCHTFGTGKSTVNYHRKCSINQAQDAQKWTDVLTIEDVNVWPCRGSHHWGGTTADHGCIIPGPRQDVFLGMKTENVRKGLGNKTWIMKANIINSLCSMSEPERG